MSKKNTRMVTGTELAAVASMVKATTAQPVLVIVKRDLKFRGARQAWYERLIALDGKPKAEVLAELEAKRPSEYGAKSRHAGKPEPVAGWVRFYERNGYIAFRA